ncbi:MAG: WD40 repeat domain-containing protein [Bacteroides sp.]|nr:WD40 repeat domain-containing protein [Bacteroides sp.]
MDKKEFYRQLMESYTVDTERVKRGAKRKSRNLKSKALMIRNWTAAAAACGAVTAAAIAVVSLGSVPDLENTSGGYDITDGGMENAMARLAAAEQQFEAYSVSYDEESFDLYVSFRKPIKRSEITMAFSVIEEYNDISIDLFYTAEGGHYSNNPELDDTMQFLGAKINAPASMLTEIKLLKETALVEYASDVLTDDTFKPFNNVTAEYTATAEMTDETVKISVPETTTVPPVTTVSAETETTAETAEPPVETTASETTAEDITETEETSEVPVDTEPADEIQEPEYETLAVPVAGVKTISFINDSCFVVTTSDSIRLLSCSGGEIRIETTYYASGAKISYSSYDGSKMFIIARDGDNKTRLYYADGETPVLCEVDVSAITSGGAELSSVSCSSDGKIILMKTVSLDKTIIYYGQRSEGTISLANKEYSDPASVLAYSEGVVYTAVTDSKENTVKIYGISTADGTETELAAYTGSLKYVRSPAINMAFLTVTNEAEEINVILDRGSLIPVEVNQVVFSGVKNDTVMIGDSYFTVNGGELTEISAEEAAQYFEAVGGNGYEISESGEASVVVKKQQT